MEPLDTTSRGLASVHRERGVGIVNNDLYRGLVVWNRCRWVRLASDSKRRRVVMNPEAQWVQHPDESLRIVSDETWSAVKRRQDEHSHRIGERVARGVAVSRAGRTGRNSRYMLSGLLKCSECGSNYVMVNTVRYACAGYINGRVCGNGRHVRRDKLEKALLADVQAGLLDPEVIAEIERGVRQARKARRMDDRPARIAKLQTEVNNMVSAIGQGMLSSALRQRLQDSESELQRLRAAPKPAAVEDLLPRVPALIRAQVKELVALAAHEPVRARAALQQALETDLITLRPAEAGRGVVADFGLAPVQLMTGTESESVVAGAGFAMFRHSQCASGSSRCPRRFPAQSALKVDGTFSVAICLRAPGVNSPRSAPGGRHGKGMHRSIRRVWPRTSARAEAAP